MPIWKEEAVKRRIGSPAVMLGARELPLIHLSPSTEVGSHSEPGGSEFPSWLPHYWWQCFSAPLPPSLWWWRWCLTCPSCTFATPALLVMVDLTAFQQLWSYSCLSSKHSHPNSLPLPSSFWAPTLLICPKQFSALV